MLDVGALGEVVASLTQKIAALDAGILCPVVFLGSTIIAVLFEPLVSI